MYSCMQRTSSLKKEHLIIEIIIEGPETSPGKQHRVQLPPTQGKIYMTSWNESIHIPINIYLSVSVDTNPHSPKPYIEAEQLLLPLNCSTEIHVNSCSRHRLERVCSSTSKAHVALIRLACFHFLHNIGLREQEDLTHKSH